MSDDFDEFIDKLKTVMEKMQETQEETRESAELSDDIGELLHGREFGTGMEALIMTSVSTICSVADSRMHAMSLAAHMCRQILTGVEMTPLGDKESKLQ